MFILYVKSMHFFLFRRKTYLYRQNEYQETYKEYQINTMQTIGRLQKDQRFRFKQPPS